MPCYIKNYLLLIVVILWCVIVLVVSAICDWVDCVSIEDGKLYVWGGGSEGQLGLAQTTEMAEPTLLPFDESIVYVACGYYHTAFVTGMICQCVYLFLFLSVSVSVCFSFCQSVSVSACLSLSVCPMYH